MFPSICPLHRKASIPLFSTISFSSPLSLSKLTSSCLDVSLEYKCYRFFSLSHTNSSPFVPVLFQRPLSFNGIWVVQGQNICQPLLRLQPLPWLVRAPAWRVVTSKGACYTLPVKVAGEKETMRGRPVPVSASPGQQ